MPKVITFMKLRTHGLVVPWVIQSETKDIRRQVNRHFASIIIVAVSCNLQTAQVFQNSGFNQSVANQSIVGGCTCCWSEHQ